MTSISSNNNFRGEFYNKYQSTHQGSVSTAGNRANLEATILQLVPPQKDSSILDCGCGEGVLLSLLRSRGYENLTGIDISTEQIDVARRTGLTRVFVEDIFDHASNNQGSYDVLLAIDVAEHFDREQVHGLFSAWFRLLRPGGRLVLRTPNGSSPFSGRLLYSDLTHGVIYTDRSLKQVCRSVGFSEVSCLPVRPSGSGIRRRLRRIAWMGCEALIRLPLIVETGQARGHIVTQNIVAVAEKP